MQHLSTQAGQLQHLVEGDLVQLAGPGDMAGIGGVHAIYVGVDLAQVCVQGGGQGGRQSVGAPRPRVVC